MTNNPLADLSAQEREIIIKLAEVRKLLVAFKTPRAMECVRTIDDVGKEITGDAEFFHARGHKIP